MKIGELVYHNCDRSYCKIPDFTLPKLGIIPDFVL